MNQMHTPHSSLSLGSPDTASHSLCRQPPPGTQHFVDPPCEWKNEWPGGQLFHDVQLCRGVMVRQELPLERIPHANIRRAVPQFTRPASKIPATPARPPERA